MRVRKTRSLRPHGCRSSGYRSEFQTDVYPRRFRRQLTLSSNQTISFSSSLRFYSSSRTGESAHAVPYRFPRVATSSSIKRSATGRHHPVGSRSHLHRHLHLPYKQGTGTDGEWITIRPRPGFIAASERSADHTGLFAADAKITRADRAASHSH